MAQGFDYLIYAILALSTLFALIKGFIKTSLSFIGWIGALFLSFYLWSFVNPFVKQFIQNEAVAFFATNITSFIVAIIIISIINGRIISFAGDFCGGAFDRALGFAFGFIRGCIISCIIFAMICFVYSFFTGVSMDEAKVKLEDENSPKWLKEAKSYQLLKSSTNIILTLLPHNFTDSAKKTIEDLKHKKTKQIEDTTKEIIKDQMIDMLNKEAAKKMEENKVAPTVEDKSQLKEISKEIEEQQQKNDELSKELKDIVE